MIFSSVFFVFLFLPIVLLAYFIVPGKLKNVVILISSLIFYAWGEPVYIVLMIFSIVYNYIAGIEIDYHREEGRDGRVKFVFLMSVVVNLLILGFFKYYGFVIDNLNHILPIEIPNRALALPIGISFYTFQTLSYVIDVYWGNVKVQKNLIYFGTYISMFPQLIAGPIVRYADVEEQLSGRRVSLAKIGSGAAWFLRGLGKKVLLANNIGMAYDAIAALPGDEVSVLAAWIGCAAYTFQIYFDFSGYSDMAVGLGKMFGFEFKKNFFYPYVSKSVTEFWRRWHISLGTWFRDYVYIPLGGNRVSKGKHVRNIMVVWMLTGLWHGAAWNFVMWGLYYGILLLIEKYALAKILEKLPAVVSHIYCLLLVMVGWVFFFSPTLGGAVDYLKLMAGIGGNGVVDRQGLYILLTNGWMWIMLVVGSTPAVHDFYERFIYSSGLSKTKAIVNCAVYAAMFILCIAYLVTESYNPFLYFRF